MVLTWISLGKKRRNSNFYLMNNTLILIITYRCNMTCDYCHVDKSNESMSLDTAIAAIDKFLDLDMPGARIRLFGGEPLLEYALVEKIIHYISASGSKAQIDLTTNAHLLNEDRILFFKDTQRMELIVSLDGSEDTHKTHRHNQDGDSYKWLALHGGVLSSMFSVTVNKVVSPKTAGALAEDFLFIARGGFNRINLLPAYFVHWDDERISVLRKNLSSVDEIIGVFQKNGRSIEIKNLYNTGEYPLFNTGVVVDTDGTVYETNLMMHRLVYPHRKLLSCGTVKKKRRYPSVMTTEQMIEKYIPQEIIMQTKKVDQVLSEFTSNLMKK